MTDTLIEIMSSLQGINSRVDEAKNQITDLEYKEAKNPKKTMNSKNKKESPKKKMRIV